MLRNKFIFILLLCTIFLPGYAQFSIDVNPCNAGNIERFVDPGVRLTDLLPTITSSSEQETDTSSIFVEEPNSGGVLITAPLVPEDESPESEANPNEFPYFGLEYSQGIYRFEHNPSNTAVIRSEAPQDPNEIVGLEGYDAPGSEDTLRWVSPTQSLTYTIYFENDPAFATAAASKVTITMPLHEKLDYATFGVGSFGFGSFVFPVDGSPSTYQTRIDLRDTLGIDLDVVAGLDIVNHEAFWIFQSIDPATGLPPTDINLGFLAINDSLHSGEGFVTCTVKPLADACVTGDTVTATASIVFDVNEAIETNTWVNTVDAVAPTSTLTMTPNSAGDMLTATFDGEDDEGGCGVKQYKLYYSVNDNAYQLYSVYPAGNSAEIPLEMGMEYEFFVLAEDNVGNCEPMKNQPEYNIGTSNFTLTVEMLPQDAGTVDGGGSYPLGDTAQLAATPAEGYHFVSWMNGGVPVSTDNPYKVEVTQNQTYTAFFELNQYTLQTEAADGSTITVTDLSGNEVPSGSTILHFDQLLVTINTADCYTMGSVTLNGADYVSGETLTVTGDITLVTTTTAPAVAHIEVEDEVCQGHAYEGYGFTLSETETVVPGLMERTVTEPSLLTGCDSVVKTLHLTVKPSAATDDHLDICEYELPYTYGDTVFEVGTESSVFNFHLSTVDGCDSIVTLFLTVDPCIPDDPDAVMVVIVGNNETDVYDGAEHDVSGYEVRSIMIGGVATTLYTEADFSLAAGVTATASRTDAGRTNMGLSETSFVNNNTAFETVIFRVTDGYQTITPRPVTLISASDSREYNGDTLTNHNVTVGGDGFVDGEGATYEFTGGQLLPGSSDNTFNYTLNSGTLADNYDITTEYGTLTVNNRTAPYIVTMTSNSIIEPIPYDGYEHTVNEFETHTFTITEGGNTHTYTVSGLTASVTAIFAGTYEDTISGIPVVTDEHGNVVTNQFMVLNKPGTLTIAKRNITFTIDNEEVATKEYDGTPLTVSFDQLHVEGLAETDTLIAGTITTDNYVVGEYPIYDGNEFYMMAAGSAIKSGFKIKHASGALAAALASYTPSFTITLKITPSTFVPCVGVDYLGHHYDAVQIGSQCWLAENLRNTVDAAGNSVAHRPVNDDPATVDKFGYLYSWYSAVGVEEGNDAVMPATLTDGSGGTYVQGICPTDWAVPSHEDVNILRAAIGDDVSVLKDVDPQYWIVGSAGVTPNTGFNARAEGLYNSTTERFEKSLLYAYFWESDSQLNISDVISAVIAYYCDNVMEEVSPKTDLRPVRCIRKVAH